ncbi:related to high affinity methionine permease [Cephalotrichum gorgonifer]|uniref:Related to high affinity methionine permease n=1 Tax=Cephalotrichum gorgonifer TaxID=2041049 RepID=A0AAE8N4K7_9PEZI|nr:related to high affinity methionine permease [Cephalotrichum gorgonifer]
MSTMDSYARSAPQQQRPAQTTLIEELEEVVNPDEIVTQAPAEQFRLGYLDVICLILNRIIGTGIFNSPHRVMLGTGSTGASLLFWFAGILYALSGAHVYVEYGMNVPRYVIDGIEQTVPRSGGDLQYLQYVYRKPRYKKNTILYFAVLYGISFICLGNMAGNAISFAIRVLQATHPGTSAADVDGPTVRGIAIAVATLTCFIHAISRRGGILLNNTLALVKVGILLLIIITAIAVAAGGFKDVNGDAVPNVISENTSRTNAFMDASNEANGYAQAFLSIVFAFSGFDQPNFVLGEIKRPRRTYPISMLAGISIVAVLYMAVNICYMVVVPKEMQLGGNVAQAFFQRTFGGLGNNNVGERVLNAFLAVSSLGNIIVMTYTASRMKQEIAKEGFLPFAKFFAQDADVSVGRLLRWFQNRGLFTSILRHKWFSPEAHSEKTPVGALSLHFLSCMVILSATSRLSPDDAYNVLSVSTAYLFPAFFGIFLALGILILRFGTPPETAPVKTPHHPMPGTSVKRTWTQMTRGTVNPALSVICAVIYLIGNVFPIITTWVPPSRGLSNTSGVRWFVVPTISWGALALGSLWFVGFLVMAKRRERRRHQEFVVERYPEFEWAGGDELHSGDEGGESGEGGGNVRMRPGGLVLVHETVSLLWKGRDTMELGRLMSETTGGGMGVGLGLGEGMGMGNGNGAGVAGGRGPNQGYNPNANPFAGTDFEDMR